MTTFEHSSSNVFTVDSGTSLINQDTNGAELLVKAHFFHTALLNRVEPL